MRSNIDTQDGNAKVGGNRLDLQEPLLITEITTCHIGT